MKKLILMLLVLAGGVTNVSADDVWSLRGDFNEWSGETNKFSFSGTTGTATATLTVGQTTSFKIVKNSTWYALGDGEGNVTYSNTSITFKNADGSNAYLIAGEAGSYTFTLDITDVDHPSLTVTYPPYTGKIYFYNNLSWATPYAYYLTTSYWDTSSDDKGSGSSGRPNGIAMTQVGTSNIWEANCPSSITADGYYVAFVNGQQDGYGNFWDTKAVYRGDFKSATPLFVPDPTTSVNKNVSGDNKTVYYNEGSWFAYPTTPNYERTVTSGNFGTLCLPYDATVTGATVFEITSKVMDGVTLKGINLTSTTANKVQAGKSYIFKATSTTLTATPSYNIYSVNTTDNGMLGNLSSADTKAPVDDYVVSGNKICKVAVADAVTIAPNKAYITLTGVGDAPARGLDFIGIDDETTGINEVSSQKAESAEFFNLAGQRVAQPTKGLYIVNGKKVIMK